ncbi:MAG: hypothetical protein AAFU57_03875, partial [Bacteroidota bacterium]
MYLGLMVITIALSNLQHMMIDMEYLNQENWFRKIYFPIHWFILPFFYLHVRAVLKKRGLFVKEWACLFGPVSLIFVAHFCHFIVKSQQIGISNMPDYNEKDFLMYSNLMSFVFNGVLIFICYRLLNFEERSDTKMSQRKLKDILWYRSFIKITVGTLSFGTISVLLIIRVGIDTSFVVYPFFLIVSIVLYYMGYEGVRRS